jgi:hypothetical protein
MLAKPMKITPFGIEPIKQSSATYNRIHSVHSLSNGDIFIA